MNELTDEQWESMNEFHDISEPLDLGPIPVYPIEGPHAYDEMVVGEFERLIEVVKERHADWQYHPHPEFDPIYAFPMYGI